ncbi:MAG: MBL fold metallo-hydrolase [Betaproteobacteria bacterium]|nr:MBL fold metallo-hydrolase [Betaproteobacteria bacterium]
MTDRYTGNEDGYDHGTVSAAGSKTEIVFAASQSAVTKKADATPPASKVTYPFKHSPEFGKIVQVAEGIFWLTTPLPFRLRAINAYLIEEKEGWTIVDCGYGIEEVRRHWEGVWRDQMKDKPVTRVVVTHFHPDHMGNAGWFQEKLGIRPHMAETEWAFALLAAKGLNSDDIDQRIAFYRKHGLSNELVQKYRNEVFRYAFGVPSVPDSYTRLREGDVMTINGVAWTVMIGYGHSPEHVCLYSSRLGVMIAGDQILPEITPNVGAWHFEPDANPLEGFVNTIKRFRPLLRRDTLVLPAHRKPFRGVHQRFDELEHHHRVRLHKILAATGPAGMTSADLMPWIFPGDLDGHQIGFGMHEALAHLNFLMYEGKMVRKTDADGIVRYYKT